MLCNKVKVGALQQVNQEENQKENQKNFSAIQTKEKKNLETEKFFNSEQNFRKKTSNKVPEKFRKKIFEENFVQKFSNKIVQCWQNVGCSFT